MDSVWFDLAPRFDEWGDRFDAWQDGLGQLMLGLRDDGKYAATVGGEELSIPRQVAKTFLVGRISFGLATQFDDCTLLWTAHRTRTATQTFQKLAGFAQRKAVKRYLKPDRSDGIRATNGEQEIRFRNGSRLLFGAREQGFGRGFDEVDVEVFDEAQILTEKALEDMVPATNQSRNPHGALLIFMGTPPRPVDPGEVFTARRRKALEGKPEGTVLLERGNALYVECSADPDVGRPGGPSIDDPKQIAKANPSYPHRTPQESIDRMRENLPSEDSWRREALGVWDAVEAGTGAIDAKAWADRKQPFVPMVGPRVLVADTTVDRGLAALVAVGGGEDGVPQTWVVESAAGTMWVPALVARVCTEHPEVAAVVIDERKSTEPLADAIEKALEAADLDVEIVRTSYGDMAEACSVTFDLMHEGLMRHAGDPALDAAVRSAVKDEREGAFTWSRKKAGAAAVPLVAMSLGLWEWRRRVAANYDVMDSVL